MRSQLLLLLLPAIPSVAVVVVVVVVAAMMAINGGANQLAIMDGPHPLVRPFPTSSLVLVCRAHCLIELKRAGGLLPVSWEVVDGEAVVFILTEDFLFPELQQQ